MTQRSILVILVKGRSRVSESEGGHGLSIFRCTTSLPIRGGFTIEIEIDPAIDRRTRSTARALYRSRVLVHDANYNGQNLQCEGDFMRAQVADFRVEADELHPLLATLNDTDWERATLFKGWTINDIVQHLHAGDLMAAASVAGPEPFARMQAEIKALRDSGLSRIQETRHRLAGVTGKHLLKRWYAQVADLCDKLAALPENARLKWSGPDMGVRMFTTARQMETWAHGQAIYDLMGVERQPADRLRNIAEIGVRTYGWTFTNRSIPVPGPAPYVRLAGPADAIWEWNDPSSGNAVEGSALGFCQVVTQVRNIADTTLKVTGEPARTWMSIAQCFAGPPEDPPPPGMRFTTKLGQSATRRL